MNDEPITCADIDRAIEDHRCRAVIDPSFCSAVVWMMYANTGIPHGRPVDCRASEQSARTARAFAYQNNLPVFRN